MKGGARRRHLLLLLVLVAGCAVSPQHRVHYRLLESSGQGLPQRVVLLPVEITVKEMSAGGVVEKDPQWSRQAAEAVTEAVRSQAASGPGFEILPLPELTETEQTAVREHLALYHLVGSSAHLYAGRVSGWEHKMEHFDYTLGDGLRFLREKTGAEAALIVVGAETVSTTGRMTMAVLAAAAGIAIPMGNSFLVIGLVDLESGDILWQNHGFGYARKSLRNVADAREMAATIFRNYPGLEAFRK